MIPRLEQAHYVRDYRLWLRFQDGTEGEVNLEGELWGEMFEPLRNIDVFRTFKVDEELHTITWPNGADFSPEFLYAQLRPSFSLEEF